MALVTPSSIMKTALSPRDIVRPPLALPIVDQSNFPATDNILCTGGNSDEDVLTLAGGAFNQFLSDQATLINYWRVSGKVILLN